MGKATKRKQDAERAKTPDFSGFLLRSKTETAQKRAESERFNPIALISGYAEYAIRPLEIFEARTRSLNPQTRTRELLRYAFNQYSPPTFLYAAWETDTRKDYKYLFGVPEEYRLWYLALAQGKSLYKECSLGLLSKKETFYFSTCSLPVSIPEAIWYSVIRAMGEGVASPLARKIASTKLSSQPVNEFWRGVARWFVKYAPRVHQMNDLLDYITTRHREHPEWHLKDQTLSGLEKAMRSWHRDLSRTSSMVHLKWEGLALPDLVLERLEKGEKVTWSFHQITTGKELAEEGNRQHHCVSSYAQRCATGTCSIWSVRQKDYFGTESRVLTVEVDRGGNIGQIRGYANRLARPVELSILKSFAAKNGFRVAGG
jgi:hypothetical protein